MVTYCSVHRQLFRYDAADISSDILQGSIKVTTLEACRNAEKEYFRDAEEGIRTTTALPGTNSLDTLAFAGLFGVDPGGVRLTGTNAVVTHGENAVHRREKLPNAFIFCASANENDAYMKEKFGSGCVKINDPVAFFGMIDEELRRAAAPNKLAQCVVDDVEYAPRKNNYRDHTQKHIAFIKPNGTQSTFEKEWEVRAVWIPEDFNIEPKFLKIPAVRAFLELL